MRLFITLLSVCFLWLCFITTTQANQTKKAQQEAKLIDVRKRIKQATQRIEANNRKRTKLEKQLNAAEKKINAANAKLRQTNLDINKNQRELSALSVKRKQLDSQLNRQFNQLRAQIYNAYTHGDQAQLKLLLNQENPTQLSRVRTYYDYLNQARQRRINQARSTLKNLQDVRASIEIKSASLKTSQTEQMKVKTALLKSRRERANVLNAVKKDIKRTDRELQQLKQNEKNIQALIKSLSEMMADIPNSGSGLAQLKGTLPRPVNGRPTNQFGATRRGSDLHWTGWMFNTQQGTPVKTVAGGRVAFADELRGFGLLTIIDHGNGYLSLYGHNQDLTRQVGDWVAQNEVIAHAGDSGGLERPAVYFELRYKGQPINPAKWCKK